MDEIIQVILRNENIVIGLEINGHVDEDRIYYSKNALGTRISIQIWSWIKNTWIFVSVWISDCQYFYHYTQRRSMKWTSHKLIILYKGEEIYKNLKTTR